MLVKPLRLKFNITPSKEVLIIGKLENSLEENMPLFGRNHFGEIINSKIFSSEMITIFCAGIGVALVIPLTAWITAYFFTRVEKRNVSELTE